MKRIACGTCHNHHESIAQVRLCSERARREKAERAAWEAMAQDMMAEERFEDFDEEYAIRCGERDFEAMLFA